MTNDALIRALQRWAHHAGIDRDPASFRCPYYDQCDASAGNTLDRGNGCLMSFVGREFGAEDFRLVVVGIDHGQRGGGNFEYNRAGVEKWYQIGACNFNQHYKGVVKTAVAVFGQSGDYCRRNCVSACKKSREPGLARCVIDRIAQPNLVKCTPVTQKNRTSKATWKMMENCWHHLLNELKILSPRLVVFHGVKARWVPPIKAFLLTLNPIESVKDRYGPVLYEWPTLDAHLLFLYHPSRGGLARQWDCVVVPALHYLRQKSLIPA